MRQLAAKTALLHAAEGHAGVAGAVAIEEDAAALQLARKALRPAPRRSVKTVAGQAKLAVVGQRPVRAPASRAVVRAATGPNSS